MQRPVQSSVRLRCGASIRSVASIVHATASIGTDEVGRFVEVVQVQQRIKSFVHFVRLSDRLRTANGIAVHRYTFLESRVFEQVALDWRDDAVEKWSATSEHDWMGKQQ